MAELGEEPGGPARSLAYLAKNFFPQSGSETGIGCSDKTFNCSWDFVSFGYSNADVFAPGKDL